MINTDIFIEKGKSHRMCQDYAICGMDPFPYMIVSDGCSASKDSDVGARILTIAAKNFLTNPKDYFVSYFNTQTSSGLYPGYMYDKIGLCIINNAFSIANLMNLNKLCLDATLILSFVIDNVIYTYVYGDGNIIYLDENSFEYINIKFPSGAPFYLSYYLDPMRMEGYFKTFGDKKLETLNIQNEEISTRDFNCAKSLTYKNTLKEGITYLIGSDGLNSFISYNNSEIDLGTLISEMTSFKSFKKNFLEIRLKRFLSDIRKRDITHFDDISVGGFHMGGSS